jgi:hypothetical protein
VLMGIDGVVTSLYLVVAFLSVEAWVLLNEGGGTKPNKFLSVAHLTQSLLHVLPISKLQNSRVSRCFLVHSSIVLLGLCFVFLDRGLPSVGDTYNLVHCILVKASKSWVCMTNN